MGKKIVTGKPVGFNTYKDDRNRTVYYDRISKQAYYIDHNQEKKFTIFNSKIISAVAIGYMVFYFSHSIIASIIVGIVLYSVLLYLFRKKFIVELVPVERFEKQEKVSFIKRAADNFDNGRIFIVIILSFALAGLTVYNVKSQNYDKISSALNYLLAAAACVYGFLFIIVFFYKKKNNK